MLRVIIFSSIALVLNSCSQNRREQNIPLNADSIKVDSLAILTDPANNLNIQTNSFSEIDSSGVMMFPLSMGESYRGSGSLSYKAIPRSSFWNIIFLNSKTNQYHLLSEKKMLIKDFDPKGSRGENPGIEKSMSYIFYSITTDDYDLDKKLTEDDPTYLFVSDKAGFNLRQISPKGCDLQNWQIIKSTNNILMTVRKDSDKNRHYDENDEVSTFEVDIDKHIEAREVFSTDFKNKLKIMFGKDWKQLDQ